jgi:hypothetical protein
MDHTGPSGSHMFIMSTDCGIPGTLAPSAKIQCYNMGQHGLLVSTFSFIWWLCGLHYIDTGS